MAGKIWNVKQRFIKNGQVFLKDCFVFCIETKTKLPIFKTFFLQLFSKSVHITILSSNQNHDPETCHFLFPFKKKKIKCCFCRVHKILFISETFHKPIAQLTRGFHSTYRIWKLGDIAEEGHAMKPKAEIVNFTFSEIRYIYIFGYSDIRWRCFYCPRRKTQFPFLK